MTPLLLIFNDVFPCDNLFSKPLLCVLEFFIEFIFEALFSLLFNSLFSFASLTLIFSGELIDFFISPETAAFLFSFEFKYLLSNSSNTELRTLFIIF